MVKLYGLCLSVAYIARLAPSLHRESTDSLIVMAPTFFHCPENSDSSDYSDSSEQCDSDSGDSGDSSDMVTVVTVVTL